MQEFFGPIPLWAVILAVLVALAVTLLACAPHHWVELAERALRNRRTRS